jgi:hypothetical protein
VGTYLNLGTYIDDTRGTVNGKFDLTMTISQTTGTWISLGFATQNTPSTTKDFTDTGSGAATAIGMATIIYRATNATPTAKALACFAGPKSTLGFGNITGITGNRTVTLTLDLTPANYNGTTSFGKVTWSDSVLGALTNYTYTTEPSFGSILISGSASSAGKVSALTLTQVTTSLKITSVKVTGGKATLTIEGKANTNYFCKSSDDLLTAFAVIATTPATITTGDNGDGTGDATFDVNADAAKRFYRVEELHEM